MALFTDPQVWAALVTLTALEIVLGIDNIIFISILSDRLPKHQRGKARIIGLGLAMLTRIALLFSLTWMMKMTEPFFSILGNDFSGRDIILISGGLFLMGKSTVEIHDKLEREEHPRIPAVASFSGVLIQIMLLDVVFSLDSIITAIGMARELYVMVIAVVLAVGFMMVFSGPLSSFIDRHPTLQMLALSFLILIGVALVGEGLDMAIPKGYIYFAMAFSVAVEILNFRVRRKTPPPAGSDDCRCEETSETVN